MIASSQQLANIFMMVNSELDLADGKGKVDEGRVYLQAQTYVFWKIQVI